jgi:hypothetical protein
MIVDEFWPEISEAIEKMYVYQIIIIKDKIIYFFQTFSSKIIYIIINIYVIKK